MINEIEDQATGEDITERQESDRRGLGDDRRHEDADWSEEERRTPKDERRSWVGRRQSAIWHNQ